MRWQTTTSSNHPQEGGSRYHCGLEWFSQRDWKYNCLCEVYGKADLCDSCTHLLVTIVPIVEQLYVYFAVFFCQN